MIESVNEKCGLAAVIAPPGHDATPICAKIAAGLQHRGSEGCGMCTKCLARQIWGFSFGGNFHLYRDSQRFGVVFPSKESLDNGRLLFNRRLRGEIALGHTRYRTTGSASEVEYAQPMLIRENGRQIAGAHNGNIVNYDELWEELKTQGVKLKTGHNGHPPSDSEILFRRIARTTGGNWAEKIARGFEGVQGAYSLVFATDDNELIIARDPWGMRPLSFGRVDGHFAVSSETNMLDKIGAFDQTEVGKGEMWIFKPGKDPTPFKYNPNQQQKFCDFEDWYFSWPSSRRNGIEEELIREQCGIQLAKEEIKYGRVVNADLVVGVPDTGRSGAIPFAETLGIPYRDRIYKTRHDEPAGRSFMGSDQFAIVQIAEEKYHISRSLKGLSIYLVDDSLVRGNTTRILNKALKDVVGVREVHNRYNSPRLKRLCLMGVNINRREELEVVKKEEGYWVDKSDEEIAHDLNADSVAFLLMEGKDKVRLYFGEDPNDFCGYCHGEDGPPFNFVKYDPDKLLERTRQLTTL